MEHVNDIEIKKPDNKNVLVTKPGFKTTQNLSSTKVQNKTLTELKAQQSINLKTIHQPKDDISYKTIQQDAGTTIRHHLLENRDY